MLRVDPSFSTQNGRDGRLTDSEELREIDLTRIERSEGAHCADLVRGKARESVPLSCKVGLNAPTFGDAVANVLFLGAQKEMADPVHAPTHVAFVQDLQAFRYGAVMQFPGDHVRVLATVCACSERDLAVATRRSARAPEPACIVCSSFELGVKAFSQRASHAFERIA